MLFCFLPQCNTFDKNHAMKRLVLLLTFLFYADLISAKGVTTHYYNYTQDTAIIGAADVANIEYVYANYGDTVTLSGFDDMGLYLPWLFNGVAYDSTYADTLQIVVTQSGLYQIASATAFYLNFYICLPPTSIPLAPGPITGSAFACAGDVEFYHIPNIPDCVNSYNWIMPPGIVNWHTGSMCIAHFNSAFSGDDTIRVTATNAMGTSAESTFRVRCLTTGIDGTQINKVQVNYNAATNNLQIQNENNYNIELIVTDAMGRIALIKKLSNTTTINMQRFSKGMYLYQVKDKNGVFKKGKIVKS